MLRLRFSPGLRCESLGFCLVATGRMVFLTRTVQMPVETLGWKEIGREGGGKVEGEGL